MPAAAAGEHPGVEIAGRGTQVCRSVARRIDGHEVVAACERCARFLHGDLGVANRAPPGAEHPRRRVRRVGGFELRAGLVQRPGGLGERALGGQVSGGLEIRRLKSTRSASAGSNQDGVMKSETSTPSISYPSSSASTASQTSSA